MSYRKFLLSLALPLLFLFGEADGMAQQIAVKANALMYGTMTPNLSFEIVSGNQTSLDFTLMGHYNPYNAESRMINMRAQYKYWFGGRPLVREYIGVLCGIAAYDYTRKDKVHEGNAACLGATAGYVLPMGKRWGVEFSAGVGLYACHEKKYMKYETPVSYASPTFLRVMPVNLGITFIYIIR